MVDEMLGLKELTVELMQELQQSEEVRTFVRDIGSVEITGRVVGQGSAVVATGATSVERVWDVLEEAGSVAGIAISEWSLREP